MELGVARRSKSCGWELAVCALFATNRENGISKLQFDLEARNLRDTFAVLTFFWIRLF